METPIEAPEATGFEDEQRQQSGNVDNVIVDDEGVLAGIREVKRREVIQKHHGYPRQAGPLDPQAND